MKMARQGLCSAKTLVPRSFHFPNLVLRALCVWFMILAPFNPISAYWRMPKRRAIRSNNHLAAKAHTLSYEHFYFSSIDTSNKNCTNWTELVQWGLTCFMNISSCILVWKMWGHLEFNNCAMSSLTILTYLISSNTEDLICY